MSLAELEESEAAMEEELVRFPELKHDDRWDAMSMALQRLRGYVESYCAVVPGRSVALDAVAF